MKIMENQFYIKKGSLCFIIPVFTEKSKVCDKYLNKLAIDLKRINDEGLDKNGRRKCRRNTIKGSKLAFINDPRIYRLARLLSVHATFGSYASGLAVARRLYISKASWYIASLSEKR